MEFSGTLRESWIMTKVRGGRGAAKFVYFRPQGKVETSPGEWHEPWRYCSLSQLMATSATIRGNILFL